MYHLLFLLFELGLVEVVALEHLVDVLAEFLVVDLVVRDSVLVNQELDLLFDQVQVEENQRRSELDINAFK